ncbi:transcriptional regulator [Streptomyces mirabilis]|uniref:transcriptional regulator n=1 Tax=Streptomyces mirabilis TaxID=68239 RepID=UPI002255091E|nr:transcriptional regulator [Streptomyces mirabilis]MCX4429467.1 transcriptional regulator [Streptomyces mirabilis]
MAGKITGAYGAHGKPGGQAISERLTELADLGGPKGFHARVSYLTKSAAGQEAMIAAGIDLGNKSTRATVLKWLGDPEATTTAAYRSKLDRAYEAFRRRNIAASLKRRLGNNGRGTRVEIHPVNQVGVTPSRQRALEVRKVNIRPTQWDRLIDQWAIGDVDGMNYEWDDIAADALGSEWGAYTSVAAIGFGA